MSDWFVARAPGKLFVLGEYAVLDGAPAIVAAVNRYVEVRVRAVPGRPTIVVDAPGLSVHGEFPSTPRPVVDGPLRFVVAAYRRVAEYLATVGEGGWDIEVRSRLDEPNGAKVGLGGSAAVTTAVVAALLAAHPTSRDTIFSLALDAHRSAQGGSGSGADVAASVYGGLLLFQPHNGAPARATRLPVPTDFTLLAGWTGESARTTDLISQYRAALPAQSPAAFQFLGRSLASVENFVARLHAGQLCVESINAGGDELADMAEVSGLGVMTPSLQRLVQIARAEGAAAKVSGAGGGDCGIALTSDASAAQRIRRLWAAAGIRPLDLNIDAEGVTVGRC